MKRVILFIFILMPVLSYGEEINGRASFKEGIELFRSEKYEEAIRSLETAHEKLPLIGDYALLYMARAYMKTEDPEKSNKCLLQLQKEYPETPLKKTVRSLLIKDVIKTDEEKAVALLESYVKDYPMDAEMRFSLGRMLKDKGQERAKAIFKDLYIEAGPFSEEAFKELDPFSLGAVDIIKRAENLIKAVRYEEAECCLRTLLPSNDRAGSHKKNILETLGLALFRQKKYKEAGVYYLEAGNYYDASQSFYRAKEYDAFNETLQKLISMNDERAGRLLVLSAVDERRAGNTDEALKIFKEVKAKYPSYREQALWHAGWTYYLNADYKNALGIFTGLYDDYRDIKYLYWKAKAADKTGQPVDKIYKELKDKKVSSYYTMLLSGENDPCRIEVSDPCRIEVSDPCRIEVSDPCRIEVSEGAQPPPTNWGNDSFIRADILKEAGLKDDAVRELVYMARDATTQKALIELAYKLKEMNEYQRAITLILSLPDEMRPSEILYPLAYWPIVVEVSREFDIDPFLVLSVIREESRFDPNACSKAGAVGIMQIMPETANRLAPALKININNNGYVYDVRTNIKLGSYYLHRLLNDFGSLTSALAAYNAGEHKVKAWLKDRQYDSYDEFIEDIPYQETQEYIKRILLSYFQYKNNHKGQCPPPIGGL